MRVRVFKRLDGKGPPWKVHWRSNQFWRAHIHAEHVRLVAVSWVVTPNNAYAEGHLLAASGAGALPEAVPEVDEGYLSGVAQVFYRHGVDEAFLVRGGDALTASGGAEFQPNGTAWYGDFFAGVG